MCTATAISNGGKVLVHCAQGRSRSASMVIAYLMKQQHMSFHQALSQVKEARPIISPNEGFMAQLQKFEKTLNAK
jgi:protein-tyrosine phosphatase